MIAALMLAATLLLPQQDVSVEARLSSSTTAARDVVLLSVTVRSGSAIDAGIVQPALPSGLRIIGSDNARETQIAIPGGRTSIIRTDFRVLPLRPGTYAIPAVVVQVNGRTLRTEPLTLTVLPAAQAASESAVRLEADITPDTAYVGEQLTLTMAAVLPSGARLRPLRSPSFDPPSPDGFWIQDLPDPITVDERVAGGTVAEVQTYHRVFFPLSAGRFSIPPGRILYDVRGGVFFAPETREIHSPSLPVTILPLPDAGRPAHFTGAVGSFTVSGELDRTDGVAGDAFTYTLRIEGEGNIKALQPPAFPDLEDVEVYPPSEDATLRVVNARIGGVRTFQWVLVPREPGTVSVPALSYSWFDAAREEYVSAATPPVTLRIRAAPVLTGADTSLAPHRTQRSGWLPAWTGTRSFLLLQLMPLFTFAAALALRAQRGGARGLRRRKRADLRRRLHALQAFTGDDARPFLVEAIALIEDVRTHTHDEDLRARCTALQERLRATLYAGHDDAAQRRSALADITRLVNAALGSRTWPAAAVVLFLALALPGAAVAQREYGAGIAALQRGDHAAAAAAFRQYVAAQPADAAGWYNLGLAQHHAGRPGDAVWAWLHARSLAPRAEDVAHNLRVAGAGEAVAATATWIPASDAELRIALALCWWLLLLALAAHVVRPRRSTRIAALVFLAVGLLAAVPLVARAIAPQLVVPLGQGATLFAGPTTRTEAAGRLEVGEAARVIRREGDWLLVRSPSFSEGWLQAERAGGL